MLPCRYSGRLPDHEVSAFNPTHRLKRWIFAAVVWSVAIGLLLFQGLR